MVVDDYLPIKNGRPLFAKSSDPNEFWSALMEKAYAKLFGNYQAINFGNSIDSLEDFTGGLAQRFYLSALGDESFQVLIKAYNQNLIFYSRLEHQPSSACGMNLPRRRFNFDI